MGRRVRVDRTVKVRARAGDTSQFCGWRPRVTGGKRLQIEGSCHKVSFELKSANLLNQLVVQRDGCPAKVV